jgi:hypothetical protein
MHAVACLPVAYLILDVTSSLIQIQELLTPDSDGNTAKRRTRRVSEARSGFIKKITIQENITYPNNKSRTYTMVHPKE